MPKLDFGKFCFEVAKYQYDGTNEAEHRQRHHGVDEAIEPLFTAPCHKMQESENGDRQYDDTHEQVGKWLFEVELRAKTNACYEGCEIELVTHNEGNQ